MSAPAELHISSILKQPAGLSDGFRRLYLEAIRMCMDRANHSVGVIMKIKGSQPFEYSLVWEDSVTEEMRGSWKDEQDVTEYGACGIACLLIANLTSHKRIERSAKGTGIDYWVSNHSDVPFQKAARLEISGIKQGGENIIQGRVNQKKTQAIASSASGLPVYIVVVEFSQPSSHFENNGAH